MKITSSLDWSAIGGKLVQEVKSIGYNPDLWKMMKNIDKMVDELSKLEVVARRTHKNNMIDERVMAINKAIDHLEKLLLIAKLMA